MKARRWSKWWWQDWQRDPALRMCSAGARGVWMDMLAIMFDAEPHGHLLVNGRQPTTKQLATIFGMSEKESGSLIKELEDAGVFSRASDGTVYNRRMVRDKATSEQASEYGKQGGNPKLVEGDNGPLKAPHKVPLKHQEAEAEAEKKEYRSLSLTPSDPPRSRDREFDEFWQRYPRKVGKDAARRAFERARKSASQADILGAIDRQQWNPDPAFQPHPATWLNGGRWQDDPCAAAPIAASSRPAPRSSNLDWMTEELYGGDPH